MNLCRALFHFRQAFLTPALYALTADSGGPVRRTAHRAAQSAEKGAQGAGPLVELAIDRAGAALGAHRLQDDGGRAPAGGVLLQQRPQAGPGVAIVGVELLGVAQGPLRLLAGGDVARVEAGVEFWKRTLLGESAYICSATAAGTSECSI